MGTFPPMSNSLLIERSRKCREETFTIIEEVLSKDVLTMQEKEEVKQAIDQVLHIYQRVKEQEDGE